MAAVNATRVASATLATTTADVVTLTAHATFLEVTNRDGTNVLWVSYDGTAAPATPVAGSNEFLPVMPNQTRRIALDRPRTGVVVGVVGNGGGYTVAAIHAPQRVNV